jgi:hypothetical protein
MTDFTKFEFGASFEVLWLKSPTSPSPKPLCVIIQSLNLTRNTTFELHNPEENIRIKIKRQQGSRKLFNRVGEKIIL